MFGIFGDNDPINGDSCLFICHQPVEVGPFDAYTYVTMGIVCCFLSLVIVFVYFMVPQFRFKEGDIILMISFSDLILGVHWILSGLNSNYVIPTWDYQCIEGKPQGICTLNGTLSTIGGTGTMMYNISFVVYIAMGLKYKLTQSKINKFKWIFHAVPLFGVVMVLSGGFSNIEQTFWGTCSLVSDGKFSSVLPSVLILFYCLLVIFSFFWANRELPNSLPAFKAVRKTFLGFYSRYLYYSLAIWASIAVIYSVSFSFNFGFFQNCQSNSWNGSIYGIAKIVNSIKMASPIALAILRFSDPILLELVLEIIGYSSKKSQTVHLKQDEPVSEKKTKRKRENFVTLSQQMQYNLQIEFTELILQNICNMEKSPRNTIEKRLENIQLTPKDFQEKADYIVENLKAPISQELSDPPLKGHPDQAMSSSMYFRSSIDNSQASSPNELRTNYKIVHYAPKVFKKIIQQEELSYELRESLDVQANYSRIISAAKSDGGASGEFFFATSDDRLLIKSITETELEKFLSMLQSYSNHFSENPDSTIAKIYGLYTLTRVKPEKREFNLILMRNIVGVPKDYILSIYDLKGSTISRQVFKKEEITPEMQRKRTMKDIDFLNVEATIKASQPNLRRLMRAISADSKILSSLNIMDYSLLVVKIAKKQFLKDYPDFRQPCGNENSIYSIGSVAEEGVYYHIAIIDYFQEWDWNKRLERAIKKTRKCKKSLDVSAQEPSFYQRRFVRFVNRILCEPPMDEIKDQEAC